MGCHEACSVDGGHSMRIARIDMSKENIWRSVKLTRISGLDEDPTENKPVLTFYISTTFFCEFQFLASPSTHQPHLLSLTGNLPLQLIVIKYRYPDPHSANTIILSSICPRSTQSLLHSEYEKRFARLCQCELERWRKIAVSHPSTLAARAILYDRRQAGISCRCRTANTFHY